MALIDISTMGFVRTGADVKIFELARITSPEHISLGSHIIVDDFVFLQGGRCLEIGSYVHIASFASVSGGGEGFLGAFVAVASGARVLTGTDLADGSGLIGPSIPAELRAVKRTRTVLSAHAFVGANAVVMAGVTIGTGAVIGAGGVVTRDVEPWTINVGCPCRAIKQRPSKTILEHARRLGIEDDQ